MTICKKCGGTDYNKSGHCKPCQKINKAAYYVANKGRMLEANRVWRTINADKVIINHRKYYEANKEKVNTASNAYYCDNKEKMNSNSMAWREANPDKAKALTKAWVKANPDRIKSMRVAYYASNKEKLTAYGRAYYAANNYKYKDTKATWRKANPEIRKAIKNNYRARKLKAGGTHTAADIRELFTLQQGKCPVCKTSINDGYHIDHVMPLIKGGSNDKLNLQLLCQPCNNQKSAKDPLLFMQSRGFLL